MKHYLQSLIIILCFSPATIFCQHLINATYIGDISKAQITFSGVTVADYDVQYYKVLYNTVDVHGNPTQASGMVAIPQGTCTSYPLLTYHHGTVLNKEDVPSRDNFESLIGKVFASEGYIVAMPDYLGLGDNPGLHPYVHAESEATSAIDIMRATREFIQDSLGITDNGEVFLTGYSQGGHASMATHKYIQDNNLETEFNLIACGPASGPYNMSGSQSAPLISNQPYSNPGYIVYLLMSYELAYGNIYNNLSDVLQSPYDTLVVPYFDGSYDMGDLNPLLPTQLNQLLQPAFLQAFINDSINKTHPLWQALLDNDNYDWKPNAPVEMYYCTNDEQVNFQNALDAESAMTANGATNVSSVNSGALDHGGCVVPSMQAALGFFDSLRDTCSGTSTSIPDNPIMNEFINIFPNPVNNQLSIHLEHSSEAQLTIYNVLGRKVYQSEIQNSFQLNTEDWKNGVYYISLQIEGEVLLRTIVKQ